MPKQPRKNNKNAGQSVAALLTVPAVVPGRQNQPVPDYLFHGFTREHRPLRSLLEERARTARVNVDNLRRDEFEDTTDAELVHKLTESWRQFALRLVRHRDPVPFEEPVPSHRRNATTSAPYWRWTVSFPLAGNLELLQTWPAALDMEPCGSDLYYEPAPEMVWQMGRHGPVVVLDVPQTEDETGEVVPRARVLAATKLLDQVIQLINDELEQFDRRLLRELTEAVKARRERLGRIKQRATEMIELVAKECPPLLVDVIAEAQQTHGNTTPTHSAITLHVAVKPRTFDDLVRICRQWIESAQRFPFTFAQLKEDDITSIVVSVLNIVFDTAHREVFIGEGKSDIYVEAARGDRTCAAYVGEAKFWSGQSKVEEHLNQILRYAPYHVRQVMLLYYVRDNKIDLICKKGTSTIQGCSGIFRRWIDEGVVAILRHPKFDHEVQLAVVYAHFPRYKREQASPRQR